MLEGNEIEKKFDGGEFVFDADDQGGVKASTTYSKDFDGYAKAEASVAFSFNVFNIAEKIAAKTETPWDDTAIAGLKKLLGIKD